MYLYNLIKEQVINVCCVTSLVSRNEMCHLSESINNHEDRIMSILISWQTQNEIHTHSIPRPSWNSKWCIQSCVLDSPLSMLAYSASAYKLLNFRPHPWPKIEMA